MGWTCAAAPPATSPPARQYYGCPELSVRNAAHPLMRANASGFRVDRLRKPPHASEALAPQHTAPPDSTADFYTDGTHPTGARRLLLWWCRRAGCTPARCACCTTLKVGAAVAPLGGRQGR